MSPFGHISFGFIAKRYVPSVSIFILLGATWVIDAVYMLLAALGIESENFAPYSHTLVMALVYTFAVGGFAWLISRKVKIGAVLGLLVFSHWLMDFVVWSDFKVSFNSTREIGLGLYDSYLMNFNPPFDILAPLGAELALLVPAVIVYVVFLRKQKKAKKYHMLMDGQSAPVAT